MNKFYCMTVLNWHSVCQALTLKRVEDAGQEENDIRERSIVQEGQTPGCPKETAETPDAEKSHTVLPPFIPGADLSVDKEEHHNARAHQGDQGCHVGEVVGQQGLGGAIHPAPGNNKYILRMESKSTWGRQIRSQVY